MVCILKILLLVQSNNHLLSHNSTLLFALLVTIQIHWVIYTARNKLMNDLAQFMTCDITVIAYLSAKYPIIRRFVHYILQGLCY